jgi:hypothetical protein
MVHENSHFNRQSGEKCSGNHVVPRLHEASFNRLGQITGMGLGNL